MLNVTAAVRSVINDEYCDFANGSDEPRTSACSHLSNLPEPVAHYFGSAGKEVVYFNSVKFACPDPNHGKESAARKQYHVAAGKRNRKRGVVVTSTRKAEDKTHNAADVDADTSTEKQGNSADEKDGSEDATQEVEGEVERVIWIPTSRVNDGKSNCII